MAHAPLSPWRTNNFLDTCAFDPKYQPEDAAAHAILRLHDDDQLRLVLAHSVAREIDHPNTPPAVKSRAASQIYSTPVGLTPDEQALMARIHATLTGNGKFEKYIADATHIFEAQKYGSYFVTADQRLLKKAEEVATYCSVIVLLPSAFLELANDSKA